MNKNIVKLAATFFGVGYLPLIPGTWGSLAGIIIYCLFLKANLALHLGVFFTITILGLWICSYAERIFGKKDPGVIVIDEVAGMLFTYLFVPYNYLNLIFGFFLFRLFDTIKPPPTDRFENLYGAYGIMSDDLIAGIYSNICLQAVNFIANFFYL